MKTTVSQKIKTGIFTLVGILLFVIAIFVIGSKQNMFGSNFHIYGTFKNVGGLQEGNNIRFAGITVGTVDKIRIVSDTSIRVDMILQKQVKPFLKADAVASISSDGLMGDKLITISSGSTNEVKMLADGSRINTMDPVNFEQIITKITRVADNAEVITGELANMAIQVNTGPGTLNRLLYSNELSQSLDATASNAQKVTGSLAQIVSHVQSGKGTIGSLFYTDTVANRVENAVYSIKKAADGFHENMLALHDNFLFKKYYKRKAKENGEDGNDIDSINVSDGMMTDMKETELEELITDAQKALDAKRKKN